MEILGEIPFIKSERLSIKRPTSDDTDAVRTMASDAEVYRFLPGFLFELLYDDPIGASRYIESYKVEVLGIYWSNRPWDLLGLVEIYDYDRNTGDASIGYRLRRDAWGQGVATEAVDAVLRYLNTRADVRVVHAEVMVGNNSSIHVLEKCGFVSTYVPVTADWGLRTPVETYTFVRRF